MSKNMIVCRSCKLKRRNECPECHDLYPVPTVLVEVRGGVAEAFSRGHVDVLIVDYDNEPKACVPDRFRRMPCRKK